MSDRSVIAERRKKILDYITANKEVEVSELVKLFNTTESTIRRDLIEIEKTNLIFRTHGGAIRNEQKKSIWQTSSLINRLDRNREQKERIAEFTCSLIKNNESLFIDGGSTTQILASYLKDKMNMLFVTNAIDISQILIENESNHTILIGGEVAKDTHLTIGPDAEAHIRKYYVDKCIIGVTGLDPDIGGYSAIPEEGSIKHLMMKHSRETIVIIDSTKFSRKAFCICFPIEDINTIVTDTGAPKEIVEKLRSKGVNVVVV
mgnify:CR=1 FL=1